MKPHQGTWRSSGSIPELKGTSIGYGGKYPLWLLSLEACAETDEAKPGDPAAIHSAGGSITNTFLGEYLLTSRDQPLTNGKRGSLRLFLYPDDSRLPPPVEQAVLLEEVRQNANKPLPKPKRKVATNAVVQSGAPQMGDYYVLEEAHSVPSPAPWPGTPSQAAQDRRAELQRVYDEYLIRSANRLGYSERPTSVHRVTVINDTSDGGDE